MSFRQYSEPFLRRRLLCSRLSWFGSFRKCSSSNSHGSDAAYQPVASVSDGSVCVSDKSSREVWDEITVESRMATQAYQNDANLHSVCTEKQQDDRNFESFVKILPQVVSSVTGERGSRHHRFVLATFHAYLNSEQCFIFPVRRKSM